MWLGQGKVREKSGKFLLPGCWQPCISISKVTIFGSENGLLPGWRQAIIWTTAGLFLIVLFHNNFSPSGEQPEHCKLSYEL